MRASPARDFHPVSSPGGPRSLPASFPQTSNQTTLLIFVSFRLVP